MSKLRSINHEQRLYVIHSGTGYSCLGFEFADRMRKAVMQWVGHAPQDVPLGTVAGYDAYLAAMEAGAAYSRKVGKRCEVYLEPALIGLEGKRVEVAAPNHKERFYVGKSTGWMPAHLAIKTRRSSGGCIAYVPEGATVRVVGSR